MQYLYIYAIYAITILIALFLLWKVIIFMVIFGQISKIAMQYEKYEIKANKEFPGHLKQLFKYPVKQLQALGFNGCCCLLMETIFSVDLQKEWGVLLYNQEFKTYAIVSMRRAPEPFYWFKIIFFSFFKDKTLLLTTNGEAHGIIHQIPDSIVQDPYSDRTEVQWQVHRDKFEKLVGSKQPCDLSSNRFVKAIEIKHNLYIDSLANSSKILPVEGTKLFRVSLLTAIKTAIKVVLNNSKTVKINKQRQKIARKDTTIAVDLPVEIEVENFLWMQQMEKGRVKPKMAGPILVVSLVLFAISFIPLFNSTGFFDLQGLLIIIGVIFLHEAGHFLAMKCFGYQDKSMFFIPFFGAAVTGHKDEATLTEKVWMLLAGPLPGLLMGIGLAIAIYGKSEFPEWLTETSWMLIGINLLNLFPIYPLDGGKIADLLLFSWSPYTDVIFKLFAVAVLGTIGIVDPIIFLVAIVVGVTIPLGFRSAKIASKWRKKLEKITEDNKKSLLNAIYSNIKEFGYNKLPFAQRYQLAKNLLQRHQERRSKWTTRVLLIGVYCASLLGGIAGTLQAIDPQWRKNITAITDPEKFHKRLINKQIEHANQALQKNPSDANAYFTRGNANMILQDYERALADLDRAIQLDPNLAHAYQMRSNVRLQMGDEQGAEEDSLKANALMAAQMIDRANETLQYNPSDANAYLTRARANMMLQDYESAIASSSEAIKLKPNFPAAYLLRSQARRQLGDEEGAIADKQKAQDLDSSQF